MLLTQDDQVGEAAGRKAPQPDTDNSAVMEVNSRAIGDIVTMVVDLSPRNDASIIDSIVPNPKMWQLVGVGGGGDDLAGKSSADVTLEGQTASSCTCIARSQCIAHRTSHNIFVMLSLTMDAAASTIIQCQWCGKGKSSTQRILACTRCFSVGYCSKECQKADWKGKEGVDGHKLRCKPTNSTTIPCNTTTTTVRLEVKRGNENRWDDVGPINLVTDNIASISLDSANNTTTGHHNHTTPTFPNSECTDSDSRRKELPSRTQRLLGPQSAHTYNYQHSHDGVDENLLIFFHGAGDSHLPYSALGQKMQLPQTAILSLGASLSLNLSSEYYNAPHNLSSKFVELPFDLGYTWFEELDYEFTGEPLPKDHPRRLKSLKRALDLLELIVCSLTGINDANHKDVSESTTWIPERIFLFGFSAGGSLAMEMCRMWMNAGRLPLGGAICVAGGIQTEMKLLGMTKSNRQSKPTDVLIIAGERDEAYPKESALLSKQLYQPSNVQLHFQKGKGHSMIGSKDEMQLIMEFLSKRLVRRLVSMEGLSI